MGKRSFEHSGRGLGGTHQGAQTTAHTRCPDTPLGRMGGHQPEWRCHRRCCNKATNAWGQGGTDANRDQVTPNMELCMRQGHEGRGQQIRAFLAGTGCSMMHSRHHTLTAVYDTATTTSRRSRMDNHRLQRDGLNCEHQRKATNTTIHQPHHHGNPTANRQHTN